jgi:hypothetical protein
MPKANAQPLDSSTHARTLPQMTRYLLPFFSVFALYTNATLQGRERGRQAMQVSMRSGTGCQLWRQVLIA